MATSYIPPIAAAVVNVISGLPGAPSFIQYREEDQIGSGDTRPCVIVTTDVEEPMPEVDVSGAGTDTDLGARGMTYPVGISIYKERLGDITTGIATQQDFVLTCQQALNKLRLSGALTVWGTRLVRRNAWEHRDLGNGWEYSTFAILFFSSEPRLG